MDGDSAEPSPQTRPLRVLELYAGIGGMHCALQRCFSFPDGVPGDGVFFPYPSFEVVAAVDVNEVAASVYKHNFPSVNYMQRGVEGFTVEELEALRFDMVTMSPPCQPFTRQGLKKDEDDARTKSFFHFLSLLTEMAERGTAPSFVLVENVLGFETSTTHAKLVDTLRKCGFQWKEFLLSPTQFGIPNSRLRYFLIGKRLTTENQGEDNSAFCLSSFSTENQQPVKTVPSEAAPFRDHKIRGKKNDFVEFDRKEPAQKRFKSDDDVRSVIDENEAVRDKVVTHEITNATDDIPTDSIAHFLDDLKKEEEEKFLVPDKVLKRFMVMDITLAQSKRSCCFTKSYGHYVDGTGSFLQLNGNDGCNRESVFAAIKKAHALLESDTEDTKEKLDDAEEQKAVFKIDSLTEADMTSLRDLKLRYFTPSEIAKIHCLSTDFRFPSPISRKQCWKFLGNGLNAHVVAVLMRLLLTERI